MKQFDEILAIQDLKERLAALKELAHHTSDQAAAVEAIGLLLSSFHQSHDNQSWGKACLKTAVFLINKHKVVFSDNLNPQTEKDVFQELQACASSKEQFILLKSRIRQLNPQHATLLDWIDQRAEDELISKIRDKLLPIIHQSKAVLESTESKLTAITKDPQVEASALISANNENQPDMATPDIPKMPSDNEMSVSTNASTEEAMPELPPMPNENWASSDDLMESTELPSASAPPNDETFDEIPAIPDAMPEIPDLPDEDEYDEAEDLSDDNDIDTQETTTFHPLRGRTKKIGIDHPKPESPGATWVSLVFLILPAGLLLNSYQSADNQSLLSFILSYLGCCIFIQFLYSGQLYISGAKPTNWPAFLIPTMPLYSKTSFGNPVCPQPLAMLSGVVIVLSIYFQPQVMAQRSKRILAAEIELTKESSSKDKEIKTVKSAAVTKQTSPKKRKNKKRSKRKSGEAKTEANVALPEVSIEAVRQELPGRSEDVINAVFHHRMAILRNSAESMSELGYLHDAGQGVKEDRLLSYTWYSLAIKNGRDEVSSDAELVKQQLSEDQLKKVSEYLAMDLSKIPFVAED